MQRVQAQRPGMAEPLGFLSYTRKDDQFFGGYITAFREALEAGVQVLPAIPLFGCFRTSKAS